MIESVINPNAFAPVARGVTGGDTHDHTGGAGEQIDHEYLANKGTNTHVQIDEFISTGSKVAPGDNYEVIYNNSGVLNANPNFTFNSVTGEVTIGANLKISNPEILPDNPLAIGGDVDSYLQVNLKNTNSGTNATVDYVTTTDDGNDETGYGDFGLCNSGYAYEPWNVVVPHDAYFFCDGGNIAIGSLTPGKDVKIFCAETDHECHPEDVVATVSSTGIDLKGGCAYSISGVTIPTNSDIARIELENIEAHGGGLVSGGTIIPTGGMSFMVLPYIAYISDGTSTITRVQRIAPVTGLVTLYDGLNVICIGVDNEIHILNSEPSLYEYVLLGIIFTVSGNTIMGELLNTPNYCGAIAQRVTNFVSNAIHTLVEDGMELIEGATPLSLSASSGVVNLNLESHSIDATTTFFKMFYCTDVGWTVSFANPNLIEPALYNDMSQPYLTTLKTVTPTYWTKSLVYRTPSGLMYWIYGQHEYATEDEAKNAAIPTVPENIDVFAIYLGIIVAQAEDISIGLRITDVRPYLPRIFGYGSSAAGIALDHGTLIGLLDDDHIQYHNDARGDARYASITSGVINGSNHDHTGGAGATIAYSTLSGRPVLGDFTESTSSILSISNGTDAVIGSGIVVEVKQANVSQGGYLSSTDWGTFNDKQDALSIGNLTVSSPLNQVGGTGAVIGSGVALTIDIAKSDGSTKGVATFVATDFNDNGSGLISIDYINSQKAMIGQNGFLTAEDFSTFNDKQDALSIGNLSASSPLNQTGGNGAIIGSGIALTVDDAKADGTSKGVATFVATDFNDNGSGLISIDYINGQKATAGQPGFLTAESFSTFNGKQDALLIGNLSASSPLNQTGGIGAIIGSGIALTVDNAKADGATKGVASFATSDFSDNNAGLISIDYINGQKATSGQPGFLTSTDWTNFNNKLDMTITGNLTANSPLSQIGGLGSVISSGVVLSIADAKADGTTKGASSFATNDFSDNDAGLISLDYTNGQKATSGQPGFLAAADFSTFNSKLNATRGNYKLFYSDGSGVFTEVALGDAGTILKCNGASVAPTISTIGVNTLPVTMPSLGATMQSLSASTHNLLTGSLLSLPTGCLFVDARICWEIVLIKTNAGTTTWQVYVKYGTNGTSADAAIATWTSGTNTAVVDQARLRIVCQILTLGVAATARCNAFYVNVKSEVSGLGSLPGAPGSTATFDSTVASPYLHVDIRPGASAVITTMCDTQIIAMG